MAIKVKDKKSDRGESLDYTTIGRQYFDAHVKMGNVILHSFPSEAVYSAGAAPYHKDRIDLTIDQFIAAKASNNMWAYLYGEIEKVPGFDDSEKLL